MIKDYLFEFQGKKLAKPLSMWHYIALLLTVAYIVFGLILVGVPGLSRGGVVAAMGAFLWMLVGLTTGQARLPLQLLFPLAFYAMAVTSGFLMPVYPIDYIGQVTTIWVAAISIAFFVANGVSLNVVIAGFVAMFLANMAAVAVGYDGYAINIAGESLSSLENTEVRRVSALAGQSNLLVILVFTMPFFVFLRPEKLNPLLYLALIAACLTVTFLTASRSGLPMTAVFAVFGALKLRNGLFKFFAITLGAIAAISVAVFLANPMAISIIERSELGDVVLVERTIATFDGDENSSEERAAIVEEGWPRFFEKPVFGHGPAMFQVLAGQGTYAHDNALELAVNWGSIGLFFYYLIYVVIFFGALQRLPHKAALIVPLLWLLLADRWFVLYLERPIALMLCLMIVVSYTSISRRHSRRKSRSRST